MLTLLAYFADTPYLRKDVEDIAQEVITFMNGIIANGTSRMEKLEVGGLTASQAEITKQITEEAVIGEAVVKNLEVTGTAHFFQLVIDQVKSVGGRIVLSLTSCEARHVTEETDCYRVYFVAYDGETNVTNNWQVGDLAICQSFNLGAGSYDDVSNKYYWRKVVGCSYESSEYDFDTTGRKYYYIDLSRKDGEYDPYSNAVPSSGDSIVQLGNTINESRASAIVLSAYNDGWLDTDVKAPSIAQYVGVGMDAENRWQLSSCRTTYFSREKNEIIGDLKALTEGGTVNVGSAMEEFARLTSENIEFWFFDYSPTLDNAPAAEWIAHGTADSHVGDIFYDTTRSGSFTGGTTYKFVKTGENLYAWEPVTDAQTLKSLQLIADAADDGIISGGSELSRLFLSWKEQQQKYVSIKEQSEQCDELATLTLAWLTVCRMLNDDVVLQDADNGTPSYFSDLSRDIVLSEHTINGDTLTPDKYRGYWNAYYASYANLEKAITSDVKTKITAANGQISMVVEGLKKTGVYIEDGKILLSADNTEVDGDLKLRGVIIENYEETEDTLVICDLVQHKSVSVNPHTQVLLPMLQDVQIARVFGETLTAHSVAGVNISGLKLTISAKYNPDVAKWATGARSLYTEPVMEQFHDKAVVVFADPRLASAGNYTYNEEYATSVAEVNPLGSGGYTAAGYRGGVFVCNGRRGRMLLLMPGQTLKLTSAVETVGGEDVLLWYVDNPEGFTPIDKIVTFVASQTAGADVTYDVLFTASGGSSWPSEPVGSSGSEYEEALFAPAQISASYPETTSELELEIDLN